MLSAFDMSVGSAVREYQKGKAAPASAKSTHAAAVREAPLRFSAVLAGGPSAPRKTLSCGWLGRAAAAANARDNARGADIFPRRAGTRRRGAAL